MDRYWSVFTKPWKTLPARELGALVSGLGFNGIEFPLRPGYQVEPEDAVAGLPKLAQIIKEYGVCITSIAGSADETTFAAMQSAGVSLLRVMVSADPKIGYMKSIDQTKTRLSALIPMLEKFGVTIGVQPHYGFGVFNTMELYHLIKDFDPKHVSAVWDAAHSALSAEIPEQAIDIIYDHLALVNLKTAYYRRVNGPEAKQARFEPYFTTAEHGASSWTDVAATLNARGYTGGICMPAEYTDEERVNEYIAKDLAFAKSLFSGE